jgi:hypothetical protein
MRDAQELFGQDYWICNLLFIGIPSALRSHDNPTVNGRRIYERVSAPDNCRINGRRINERVSAPDNCRINSRRIYERVSAPDNCRINGRRINEKVSAPDNCRINGRRINERVSAPDNCRINGSNAHSAVRIQISSGAVPRGYDTRHRQKYCIFLTKVSKPASRRAQCHT